MTTLTLEEAVDNICRLSNSKIFQRAEFANTLRAYALGVVERAKMEKKEEEDYGESMEAACSGGNLDDAFSGGYDLGMSAGFNDAISDYNARLIKEIGT